MIFRISKPGFLLGLIVCAFLACTNSDEYLFNDQKAEEIEISAIITTSFDTDAEKKTADTIQPGDSLIFLTTVYPSKSIRNKQYYWTMDGGNFASEYSFKKSINVPGIHKIAFVFIDFFGDTLSDTLTITVASPPIIDTEKCIPATATQSLDPDSINRFAWNSYDPDSLWDTFFHFVLQDSDKDTLVDTLLENAYFASRLKLSPLQKYTWSVSAYNEFNQPSRETLTASFFTSGRKGENAVTGLVGSTSDQENQNFKVVLLDSLQLPLDTFELSGNPGAELDIRPLAKGKYTLITSINRAYDFKSDTVHFSLNENQVLELDSIILTDKIPPRIQAIPQSDTLDIQDTLRFYIYDWGGAISPSKISVSYENQIRQDIFFSNDTLYVPFTKEAASQNWSYKLISVTALDPSNNRMKQIFYLRPNTTLQEVFDE